MLSLKQILTSKRFEQVASNCFYSLLIAIAIMMIVFFSMMWVMAYETMLTVKRISSVGQSVIQRVLVSNDLFAQVVTAVNENDRDQPHATALNNKVLVRLAQEKAALLKLSATLERHKNQQ